MKLDRVTNVGIFLLMLLISFLFGELIMRKNFFLFDPDIGIFYQTHELRETDFFYLTNNSDIPYRVSPNASHFFWWNAKFVSNSDGFFGDRLRYKENYNMLFLGDSVTFGLGTDQNKTFHEQYRQIYGAKSNVQIASISAPGYNTLNELTLLRTSLDNYKYLPDLIILQFGLNDYIQVDKSEKNGSKFYFYGKRAVVVCAKPTEGGLYKLLLDHSMLFFRIHLFLFNTVFKSYCTNIYPDYYSIIYRQLSEIKKISDQYGIKLVFLNLPYRNDLGYEKFYEGKISNYNKIFEYSLDLTNKLNNPLLWFDSQHPSSDGHREIAVYLHDYLVQKHLIPND